MNIVLIELAPHGQILAPAKSLAYRTGLIDRPIVQISGGDPCIDMDRLNELELKREEDNGVVDFKKAVAAFSSLCCIILMLAAFDDFNGELSAIAKFNMVMAGAKLLARVYAYLLFQSLIKTISRNNRK